MTKINLNLTKEEISMVHFTEVNPVMFKVELFVGRKHFVDIVSKLVSSVANEQKSDELGEEK